MRAKSFLCRVGLCLLCAVMLFTTLGCQQAVDPDADWVPPSTTSQEVLNAAVGEYIEDYLDGFIGELEYTMVKNVLADNTLEFYGWSDRFNIISSKDDEVCFTGTKTGSFGIFKELTVDPTTSLNIQFYAEFDPELFDVYINVFHSGDSIEAKKVSNGVVRYELDVSRATNKNIQLIISATAKDNNLGEPIVISGTSVWQNVKKLSMAGRLDEEAVVEIIEGTNLADTSFYIAPNGKKYLLQVSLDGGLVMSPVVPSKTLFVGNELLTGFGFGMAASDSQHDYYYLVNQAITEQNPDYSAEKLDGTAWEAAKTVEEQDAFLNDTLLPMLDEDLELVVIQLGDNVNTEEKLSLFEEGSRKMLEFVRTQCPKARVVWVGAWYQTEAKSRHMKAACQQTGCGFIDIAPLATPENQSAVGNTYIDENGEEQTITSDVVASYPGDAGFKAIANLILYKLGIVDVENYHK